MTGTHLLIGVYLSRKPDFNKITNALTSLRTVQSVPKIYVLIAKMFKVFKQTLMLTYPADPAPVLDFDFIHTLYMRAEKALMRLA